MKSTYLFGNRYVAALGVLLLTLQMIVAAGDEPNVMFIFADDHSYEALAAHGNSDVKTPNLDQGGC